MRHIATLLVAAALVLPAASAFAAKRSSTPATTGQGAGQGTPEERAACRGSVRRFCRAAGGDQSRTVSCLQEHRAQISGSCRAVLERNGL
jgi:hypothetical protein